MAIVGVDGRSLTYDELLRRVAMLADGLRLAGITPDATVGVVVDNGVGLAVALLASMAAGIAAPLNPKAGPELESDLLSLGAKAVVVDEANAAAVAEVADRLNVSMVQLRAGQPGEVPIPGRGAGEVALVLRTSGTTARPKVVPLTHANLRTGAANVGESLQLTASDRGMNVMPLFHIHGIVAGLLASLASGGSVIATPGFNPSEVNDWLERLGPTWYTAVPTIHQAMLSLVDSASVPSHTLRLIRSSSSALPPVVMERLEQAFGVPVLEAYGMTEAAHQMTVNPLPPAPRRSGTVGIAAGPEIAIWDGSSTSRVAGVTGEIVVRGPNVMSGYLGNASANAAAFVDGWFRTGDEGVFDDDDYLRLTGRLKEMINRGGEKIAPGEIDAALLRHPDVLEAVTFAVPHATLGEDVAAAVVVRQGTLLDPQVLITFLAKHLAAHKVPRRFEFLKTIPKGPTGKPIRIGLAALLALDAPPKSTDAVDEIGLSHLWKTVLELQQVREDEDFFAAGGDSLRAVRLISLIRARLGVEVSLQLFVEGPVTIASLRKVVAAAPAAATETQIVLGDSPDETAASSAESGIVFLSRLDESGVLFNTPTAMRITGDLKTDTLEAAFQDLVMRQAALRTTFHVADGAVRRQTNDTRIEVRHALAGDDLQGQMARATGEPFDLEKGPLCRALLLEERQDSYVLLVVLHHAIFDGWSADVLWAELFRAYRYRASGDELEMDAPAVASLGKLAARQRMLLESSALAAQRVYWMELFRALPETIRLPVDRPSPLRPSWAGGRVPATLGDDLSQRLRDYARAQRSTPFSVLLAALAVLLGRLGGTDQVVVGAPVANRLAAGAADTIGLLVNTLAIRVDLGGDPSFETLVQRVRDATVASWANQDYPFERLVEELRPRRDMNLNPLFSVMFQVRRSPTLQSVKGLRIQPLAIDPGTAKIDLTFDLSDGASGMHGFVEYNSDVFERDSIMALWERLSQLLDRALMHPQQEIGSLPVLLRDEWDGARRVVAAADLRRATISRLVEVQATRTPAAVAVICGNESLTYAAIDKMADGLARRLRNGGVEAGDLVGVSMRRSIPMVAAVLATLKCGAAYVPLDPAYPAARLQQMISQAELRLVITDERGAAAVGSEVTQLPAAGEEDGPRTDVPGSVGQTAPAHIACVLFTSGSTGVPNGVQVTHAAVHNLLDWARSTFSEAERARVLASTSLNFDLSIFEMFLPLTTGGALVIVDDVLSLRGLAPDAAISLVNSVPAAIGELVAANLIPDSTLVVCSAGEILTRVVADAVLGMTSKPRLFNLYGPTEATVYATGTEVSAGAEPPTIGRAIDGVFILVVDEDGRTVPPGVAGELCIGGAGLAAGYHGNPALTQKRFVSLDVEGIGLRRVYRTGDRGRVRRDGEVEYVGRMDDQLKVLGLRIEPAEIEATLCRHPAVAAAAVVAPIDRPGELVAFVQAAGAQVAARELREFVAQALPRHMVPTRVSWVAQFPRNVNGKVDRRRLAEQPAETGLASESGSGEPSMIQATLAKIWARLLERPRVSVDEDFFDLGGHSLLALRMIDEAERALDASIPLTILFDGPATIRRLAELIERPPSPVEGVRATVIPYADSTDLAPLFFIHSFEEGMLGMRYLPSLVAGHPLYGVSALWKPGGDIDSLSAAALDAIRKVQPEGPYFLAGFSLGSFVAHDVAAALVTARQTVETLILVDTPTPATLRQFNAHPFLSRLSEARRYGPGWLIPRAFRAARMQIAALRRGQLAPIDIRRVPEWWFDPADAPAAMAAHALKPYGGNVTVLATPFARARFRSESLGWTVEPPGVVELRPLSGDHQTIMTEPHVRGLGEEFSRALASSNDVAKRP